MRGNDFGSVFEAAGRRRGADQKAACFLGIANERSEQTEVVFGKLITEHPDRCRRIPFGRQLIESLIAHLDADQFGGDPDGHIGRGGTFSLAAVLQE